MSTTKKSSKPVVIAESNYLTGRLMVASLQAGGHPAVVGRDGDAIMKLLEMYDPDVLVINMNLGRPSGLELLRTLQQRQAKLKILAAMVPGQAELKAAAGALGVAGFFEVPFSPQDLTQRIEKLIEV
ncbi:MAG TPA: response regulator [Thermoanaerobaculia bacterium]|nr:response regulator [Thermoanaerobaculia bacterium]